MNEYITNCDIILPKQYSKLKYFLTDRHIFFSVPQRNVLSPVLYLINTSEHKPHKPNDPVSQLQIENNIAATFADDTNILAAGTTISR